MGKEAFIVSERLPDELDVAAYYTRGLVLRNGRPAPLMYCARFLPKALRHQLPMLERAEANVVGANDEIQYFDAFQSLQLLDEIRRLRRLCRHQEFVHGFDAAQFWERWRDRACFGDDFDAELDDVERFLEEAAVEGRWLVLLF